MKTFQIGIITKAQGIRGEFRVLPTTDDSERFALLVGGEIFVDGVAHTLEKARTQKNIAVLKLADINDRNAAEVLIGAKITIPAEKALPLDDGEFYIRDLIGLCAEDENGGSIGRLVDVLHTGANDVYVIETPQGSFMLPAIKGIVRKIDLAEKKIILRLIDGLTELKFEGKTL